MATDKRAPRLMGEWKRHAVSTLGSITVIGRSALICQSWTAGHLLKTSQHKDYWKQRFASGIHSPVVERSYRFLSLGRLVGDCQDGGGSKILPPEWSRRGARDGT